MPVLDSPILSAGAKTSGKEWRQSVPVGYCILLVLPLLIRFWRLRKPWRCLGYCSILVLGHPILFSSFCWSVVSRVLPRLGAWFLHDAQYQPRIPTLAGAFGVVLSDATDIVKSYLRSSLSVPLVSQFPCRHSRSNRTAYITARQSLCIFDSFLLLSFSDLDQWTTGLPSMSVCSWGSTHPTWVSKASVSTV